MTGDVYYIYLSFRVSFVHILDTQFISFNFTPSEEF